MADIPPLHPPSSRRLTHLRELEAESIQIFRAVVASF